MNPQLPVVLEDFPSSAGYEPLPFLGAESMIDLRQAILRGYPLSSYGYSLVHPCLLVITHLNGWSLKEKTC